MREVSRHRIDHDARKRLVRTLLRTGPLTARGLSAETNQSMGHVDHHLRVLTGTGIVEATGGQDPVEGGETTFALKLEAQPDWVCKTLLGRFSFRICLLLMNHLADAGTLGVRSLAKQTSLSENDVARYLWYMGTLGLVESYP